MAIAWRPATPAPSTSTLAGRTVPAAVVSIGKKRGSSCGRDQRGAVAGDRGLGGQRVHRLGARDPRDRLHGEARDPGVGQGAHRVAAAERVEEADQHRAAPEAADLLGRRRGHLGHHVAAEAVAERGARLLVGGVGLVRLRARAGLDHHVDPALGESLDRLGHERHAALALGLLLRYRDLHLWGRSGGQRARKGSRALPRVRRGAGSPPRLPARAPSPHPRAGPVGSRSGRRPSAASPAVPRLRPRHERRRPARLRGRRAGPRRAPLPRAPRPGGRTPPASRPTCTAWRR